MKGDKFDAYQAVTDQIITLLDQGTVPWHKPWDSTPTGLPLSMTTRKPYRGVNVFLLDMVATAKGYTSPWWGTYGQIQERGGQVRKGEKGVKIVFWKLLRVKDEDTGKTKNIPMLRTFVVFNAEQADGDLGLPTPEPREVREAIAECDAALENYYAAENAPGLRHGDTAAYYTPALDIVTMPDRDAFHSSEEYYGTLFHETVHSTGHESRLSRPGVANLPPGHRFGDELYSKEELVAEMGSAFLAARTGIAAVTLPNSAAYLDSWINVLKGDRKLVVQAAAQAQKAVDLIMGELVKVEDESTEDEQPAAQAVAA